MQTKLVMTAVLAAISAASAQNIIQLPDSLYAAGDTIAWVKRVPSYCEGPAWEAATGTMYFTRQMGNSVANWPILKIKPGVDTGSVFVANAYQANGMEFDPQGRLVVTQNGRITRYNSDGSEDSVLVLSGANGVSFNTNNGNQANDLSIASNGAMYFTALGSQVLYLSPSRQLSVAYSGASSANGVEWIEEDSAVYVNENANVRRYRVTSTGLLTDRTTFASATGMGADGGTVDAHGNRYVANYSGGDVRIFNARGDSIGRIAPRLVSGSFNTNSGNTGNVSNAAFGGADLKTLYITGDGGLFSIRLKIPGRLRPGVVALRAPAAAGLKNPKANPALENRDVRGRHFSPVNSPVKNTPALKIPGETPR